MMSCFQSADPGAGDADILYPAGNSTGHLWVRNGSISNCSSIPPPSSGCQVCLQNLTRVACSGRWNITELEMEGGGRTIPLETSGCPTFQVTGAAAPAWWLPLLIILILLFLLFLGLLVHRFWGKLCAAFRRRPAPAAAGVSASPPGGPREVQVERGEVEGGVELQPLQGDRDDMEMETETETDMEMTPGG